MAGNAAEEGLLGQIENPSHVDRGRIVVPAAILAGVAASYVADWSVPRLTLWGEIVFGTVVGVAVAWRLARWFQIHDGVRADREREKKRADQVAETERQIAAMRKVGS